MRCLPLRQSTQNRRSALGCGKHHPVAIVRHLARHLGVTEDEIRREARLSYGKVAEFQARGLVHFHVSSESTDGTALISRPPKASPCNY